MRTFSVIISFAAVIATAYGACVCDKTLTTSQEVFCAADWVERVLINAKIINFPNKTEATYHATRIGVPFKFPKDKTQPIPLQIFTSNVAGSCGDNNLIPGLQYLLAGTFDSMNRMVIDTCLTWPTKQGVKNPSAANFFLVSITDQTDLLMQKITCPVAASGLTTAKP